MNSLLSLDGRRVAIIGGASGIGFAVAELAASLGAAVVIASRDAARVARAAERIDDATGRTIDVRDPASVDAFFEGLGPFDHLAMTAGDWDGTLFVPTRDLDLAQARGNFDVRFWGALAVVQRAMTTIAPAGSITLTTGMLGERPAKGAPLAAAVGGAIAYLVRGLAVDLAPIRVNAVSPGLILTEHVLQMPEERRARTVAHLPIPRGATPAEAAQAYVYAMLNGYVTGQNIAVDGGGMLV